MERAALTVSTLEVAIFIALTGGICRVRVKGFAVLDQFDGEILGGHG
jgi:hypothetical protein